jgi:2-polyprenyl-3-methyl-5-hydroxy-6-metoxy-1,4-benzoquinol methylase
VHAEELNALIQEVKARVRAKHPEGALGLDGVAAADLMPLVHARDAAEAKVAAIGTVNPRPPGFKNNIAQWLKRTVARALDWHIREQVEFNRATIMCVQAAIEALTDTNRALSALASYAVAYREDMASWERRLAEVHRDALDVTAHWVEWRKGFEERRSQSEIHMLRTISELQAAFQHRVTLLEQSFRELARQQHGEFQAALDRNTADVQQRLWSDLQAVRAEYEKLIHAELRLIRQRTAAPAISELPQAPPLTPSVPIDWMRFAQVFRGSEERIREQQQRYAARFSGAEDVLDLGCGRGEFLDAACEAGVTARGIDQSEECIQLCRAKNLDAERADVFEYLTALPDTSLGGIYCSQVVEHIPPERLPVLVNLLAKKTRVGALAIFETPNPECLAIFATHFYLDPTHTRPVPSALLRFYLEEAGFGAIEIKTLSPAIETMPALSELPANFREAFFGGLDYAIIAKKL